MRYVFFLRRQVVKTDKTLNVTDRIAQYLCKSFEKAVRLAL